MSHKGYQVESDRIKILAELTPQKDKILELSKEEKERILFEREAKIPEPDFNDSHYIRGLPPQLQYQIFQGRFNRIFIRRKFIAGKYLDENHSYIEPM